MTAPIQTAFARLKFAIGILLVMLFAVGSESAWAVRCATYSGETEFYEPIGAISVPDTVPDGTIIWISPTRTTSGVCRKNDDGSLWDLAERIRFWGFNLGDPAALYGGDPNAWGISISILYRGQEIPIETIAAQGLPTDNPLGPCNYQCRIDVSITYQIVIRKRGLNAFNGPTSDYFSAFQFDGDLGLYGMGVRNFQYILTGMTNIKGTSCTVDMSVTPEPGIVEFGQVQLTATGFSPPVPKKPFNLVLKKECSTPIRVAGYLQTSNPTLNGLILPSLDANFGIRIEKEGGGSGTTVQLQEPFSLAYMAADQPEVSVDMSASLIPIGQPKVGPFTATATVLILYE